MKKLILIGTFAFIFQMPFAQNVKFAIAIAEIEANSGNNLLVLGKNMGSIFIKDTSPLPANGEYLALSDRRIKTNIQPLPTLLERILRLEPVEYEMQYDNPEHKRSIGFIAQDVKKIFPGLVTITSDPSGGYKGITDLHAVKYSGFTVLAIKAIQEQQQMILELRKEVNDLKAMMAR